MSCAETADLPLSRVNLAEVNPPLALGVLDGRYRAAASPLVDHLSEAALNRARVHVEVEWLIYLTDNEVLPGALSSLPLRSSTCAVLFPALAAPKLMNWLKLRQSPATT